MTIRDIEGASLTSVSWATVPVVLVDSLSVSSAEDRLRLHKIPTTGPRATWCPRETVPVCCIGQPALVTYRLSRPVLSRESISRPRSASRRAIMPVEKGLCAGGGKTIFAAGRRAGGAV